MSRFSRYQDVAVSDYPGLREVLAPQYRNLPGEYIEALFESYNLSAENIEDLSEDLKKWRKSAARLAPTILPVAGTVVGTAFGGPVGAAVGGKLGKLAGGAVSQPTNRRPQSTMPAGLDIPGMPPGLMGAGGPQQAPHIPEPLPGASPAAGQLMQTMLRPETLQALMAMSLGQLGGSNVKVDNTPVPVDAFTNLLGVLANQAQIEHQAANPGIAEGIPEYLHDYAGGVIGDPAVSDHRARVLYEMLIESDIDPVNSRWARNSQPMTYNEAEEEAFYAEFELAENYDPDDEW